MMRTPTILVAVFIVCAMLTSCTGEPGAQRENEQDASTAREDTVTRQGSADDPAAVCLEADSFVADGRIPLESAEGGAAATIDTLRWETYEGCARFVIDLASGEGRPAETVGEVRAELMRDLGVVRIDLPQVASVVNGATDARFGGLARAAYVVKAPEGGGMFVDLHLAAPAEAHVATLEDPARVVVDLRPGGAALSAPAVAGRRVVVMEPRTGEQTYPLTIRGYARTFEANVVARLEKDGREAAEMFTTSTAWVDAWGYYSMTVETGPEGEVVLHVGEHSARDGAWEGVAVELVMR